MNMKITRTVITLALSVAMTEGLAAALQLRALVGDAPRPGAGRLRVPGPDGGPQRLRPAGAATVPEIGQQRRRASLRNASSLTLDGRLAQISQNLGSMAR